MARAAGQFLEMYAFLFEDVWTQWLIFERMTVFPYKLVRSFALLIWDKYQIVQSFLRDNIFYNIEAFSL